MIKILYGIYGNTINVTDICFSKLKNNNIITIPYGDINRSVYFTDPFPGIKKSIFIIVNDTLKEYTENDIIQINTDNYTIFLKLMFIILFGINGNTIDVTDICFSNLSNKNNNIVIPSGDFNRSKLFTDPLAGRLKSIFVVTNRETREYDNNYTITINTNDNTITSEIQDKSLICNSKIIWSLWKYY